MELISAMRCLLPSLDRTMGAQVGQLRLPLGLHHENLEGLLNLRKMFLCDR